MPCQCVRCIDCGGSGVVWYSFAGEYLGNTRCDDLDDYDMCPECGGSRISELCDECRELEYEEAD